MILRSFGLKTKSLNTVLWKIVVMKSRWQALFTEGCTWSCRLLLVVFLSVTLRKTDSPNALARSFASKCKVYPLYVCLFDFIWYFWEPSSQILRKQTHVCKRHLKGLNTKKWADILNIPSDPPSQFGFYEIALLPTTVHLFANRMINRSNLFQYWHFS